MANIWVILLLSALVTSGSSAHRILVIFPFPSKSHSILGDGIVRHLLAAGNQVVYATPFLWKNPPKNLEHIDLSSELESGDFSAILNIKAILDKKLDMGDQNFVSNLMMKKARRTLLHENMQKFILDKTQKIDAVIAEWMLTDIYSGLAQIFECPYIMFVPFDQNKENVQLFSFMERVMELYVHLYHQLWRFKLLELEIFEYDSLIKPVLSKLGRPLRSFEEARNNVSLVLVNTHVSLSHSVMEPLKYIQIGGFHIDPAVTPLPKDLEDILNNSKHGVIYFSMGSNLKSKELPDELKKSLITMFGTLKQTVLWKFEDKLPHLPKNLKILEWAPQQSILSHPNCVLFITHGGLLSTTETIHFGVPIIGVPVFADQFNNVDRAVKAGIGKRVDLSYTMADDLKTAILEVVGNPSYKEKVKQFSFMYHHRATPPGQLVSHWVEHVILTQGATHLCSPALTLSWYQKLYLDLAAVALAILFIVYKILKKILKLFTRKKNVITEKKKSK